MYYLFPFNLVEPDARILLYGAGKAGKNYLNQIRCTGYCTIVCVVDKNYSKIHIDGMDVVSPEVIKNYEYDCIVLSQIDDDVKEAIEEELVSQYGVARESIIKCHARMLDWDNPQKYYETQQEEYLATRHLNDYLKEMDAGLLVTGKRIDIVVRYLLFRDFVNHVENKKHISLFSRFILARTGGRELPSYHSGKGKDSVTEFIKKGKELCESMQREGFSKEHFIPLGYESRPYDGLHRIAAALATNEKVWAHEYNDRPISEVTLGWFKENGFTTEDQIRILRAFTDTYAGKCGIFLLYAPVEDLWSYIEKQIGIHFTVVGKIDYDFQSDYVAFENLMRQVYNDWDQYSEWLSRKLDILVMAPLKYRIILVSEEERKYENFYADIRALKLELRQHLFMDIDHRIPIIVHASDSEDEYVHLRNLFLSANNIAWLNKNMRQYYRGWFLEQIKAIKNWCSQNNIFLGDVCVVGSAVMELFGIRDAHNFNIIVEHVKPALVKTLPDTVELTDFNYCLDENDTPIENHVIIEDDNWHTVFADIKFCNLDFVYRYKQKRKAEKDLLDLAKLRTWYDFADHYENKDALQRQIRRELYKRGVEL